MFRKRLNNRKGFTLIELLVVVAIIGILAAIAIPKFTEANETTRGAKIQADLRTIDSASQIYYASAQSYAGDVGALSGQLATTPQPPAATWRIKSISGAGGGAYSLTANGRAVYSGSMVENLQ